MLALGLPCFYTSGFQLPTSECAPQPLQVADLPLLVIQLSFVSIMLCHILIISFLLSIASFGNKYMGGGGGGGGALKSF